MISQAAIQAVALFVTGLRVLNGYLIHRKVTTSDQEEYKLKGFADKFTALLTFF